MTIISEGTHHQSSHSVWAGLLLGFLLFLPGALGYLYEASSFAPGTVIATLAAIMLAASGQVGVNSREMQNALIAMVGILFAVIAHLLLAAAIEDQSDIDFSRVLLSLIPLGIIILSVPAICNATLKAEVNIQTPIKILCGIFVIILVLSIIGIQPETESLGSKPTFPYTEPSFVGFSLPAILLFTTIRSSQVMRILWIALFLGLAYAIGNFTIIAACVLVSATVLPLSWLAGFLIVMAIGSASLDLSYYTNRLDFDWANSTNISALVYVQGWQLLSEALEKSHGWGLGFQQLGIGYTNVPATFRINMLLGRDANLQDGGFILSKFGSEFGALGLGLAAAYIYSAAWSFVKLRSASRPKAYMSDAELFARCCVLGYVVEAAVRGTSYFTGTFVLLLAGLFYLGMTRSGRNISAVAA